MDLQSLLAQVIQWHKDSQHNPIVQMLEILIESSNGPVKELEQSIATSKDISTQQTKASLYTYFGDSLYRLNYFRRAIRAFEQALSFNDCGPRRLSKRCKTNSISNSCDINRINSNSINLNENELKYRMHLCYIGLLDYEEALKALERIPKGERSVKVLASLADIHYYHKNFDLAKEVYIEILKGDPLRLDYVVKLCKLGGCEASTILNIIPDDIKKSYSWYPNWIQAQLYLHSPNPKKAIRIFETLTSRFEKRAPILTNLAEAHYYDGNFREAIRIFQIAYDSDPLSQSGISSYAACLHKECAKNTLEDLAVSVSFRCNVDGEYFHEPWLVLAHYYSSVDKKEPKALMFAQKAYKLNRSSVEALVLLACLCLEKKDPTKALPYIITAHTLAPYRYEVQRILCDSYLAGNRKTAALSYAKSSVKSLGETARSYYLWADITLKTKNREQGRKSSAKRHLERAVELDPNYLPAVFALSEWLIEDKKFDNVIEILNAALPNNSTNTEIHKYLYTCYSEKKDSDKALYHQNLASDNNTNYKIAETSQGWPQDPTMGQEEIDRILGLEADELVDHGDSDIEDANLEA